MMFRKHLPYHERESDERQRGTGLSGPIDCPALQTGSLALSAIAARAQQLGNTAWFYGTFVGQVLADLYPTRLRSIILDSAYPVRPPDPWFATDWAAAWSGIDVSCDRSPSCSPLGGAATSRMQRVGNMRPLYKTHA